MSSKINNLLLIFDFFGDGSCSINSIKSIKSDAGFFFVSFFLINEVFLHNKQRFWSKTFIFYYLYYFKVNFEANKKEERLVGLASSEGAPGWQEPPQKGSRQVWRLPVTADGRVDVTGTVPPSPWISGSFAWLIRDDSGAAPNLQSAVTRGHRGRQRRRVACRHARASAAVREAPQLQAWAAANRDEFNLVVILITGSQTAGMKPQQVGFEGKTWEFRGSYIIKKLRKLIRQLW